MDANEENHPPATAVPLLRKEGSSLPDFDEFKTWLQRTWPNKNWEWKHLVHIYKHLKRVWDGDCKRLMIFMPPRHGKSELVTARFPAWTLKHDPTTKIIIGCYNQPLANRFSRMVRSCLAEDASRNADAPVRNEGRFDPNAHLPNKQQSPEEPAIADGGVRVPIFTFRRKDSESEWETSQGGGVRAVGVGAGITGYGAHLIIVDDPVKSRAEAESETCRNRVWNWFNDDLYTRLEPDGKIILIQTRWHEDDLAGRLLREAEQGGEQWEVISLPALSEPPALAGGQTVDPNWPPAHAGGSDPLGRADGEALCPERYDETKLARIRRKIGSYSFAALYQQRPAPAEGGQFKRAWFRKIIDAPPPGLAWKRGYDLAVSTKQTADYTASFRCARDAQGNLYIADGFRARIEYPDQRRYILGRMQAEPNTEHGIEAALHGQAFVQDLRRERGLGRFAFRAVRVAADKLTRALSWLNLAEEGKLYLVRGPWIDAFVDEVARFPTGTHDDQIDAVSLAVNMLETRRYRSFGF
jgi:predicted phage terminase large subunit-like protein